MWQTGSLSGNPSPGKGPGAGEKEGSGMFDDVCTLYSAHCTADKSKGVEQQEFVLGSIFLLDIY